MIDHAQALGLVTARIAEFDAPEDASWAVYAAHTIDRSFGWVFFWGSETLGRGIPLISMREPLRALATRSATNSVSYHPAPRAQSAIGCRFGLSVFTLAERHSETPVYQEGRTSANGRIYRTVQDA